MLRPHIIQVADEIAGIWMLIGIRSSRSEIHALKEIGPISIATTKESDKSRQLSLH
jgi:hypothetical protein